MLSTLADEAATLRDPGPCYPSAGAVDADIALLTSFEEAIPEVTTLKKFLAAQRARLASREAYNAHVYPRVLGDIVKVVGSADKTAAEHIRVRTAAPRREPAFQLPTPAAHLVSHDQSAVFHTSVPRDPPPVAPDVATGLSDIDAQEMQRPVWTRRWSAWIAPSWRSARGHLLGAPQEFLEMGPGGLGAMTAQHILESPTSTATKRATRPEDVILAAPVPPPPPPPTEKGPPPAPPPPSPKTVLRLTLEAEPRGPPAMELERPRDAVRKTTSTVASAAAKVPTRTMSATMSEARSPEESPHLKFQKVRRRRLGRSSSLACTPGREPEERYPVEPRPAWPPPAAEEVTVTPPAENPFHACIWSDVDTDVEVVHDNGVDTDTDVESRPATRCFVLDPFDGLPHPFWGVDVEQSSWVSIPNPAKLDPECKVLRMLKALKREACPPYNSTLLVRHYKAFLKYGMFPDALFEFWGRGKIHRPYMMSESEQRSLLARVECLPPPSVPNSLPAPLDLAWTRARVAEFRRAVRATVRPESEEAAPLLSPEDVAVIDLPCPVDPTWRNVYSSRARLLKRPKKLPLAEVVYGSDLDTDEESAGDAHCFSESGHYGRDYPRTAVAPRRRARKKPDAGPPPAPLPAQQRRPTEEPPAERYVPFAHYSRFTPSLPDLKATPPPRRRLPSKATHVFLETRRPLQGPSAIHRSRSVTDVQPLQVPRPRPLAALRCASSPVRLWEYGLQQMGTWKSPEARLMAEEVLQWRRRRRKERREKLRELRERLIGRSRLRVRRGRRVLTRMDEVLREGEAWIRFHQIRDLRSPQNWTPLPPPPTPNPASLGYALDRRNGAGQQLPSFIPTIFRGPGRYEDIQEAFLQVLWAARNALLTLPKPETSNLKLWIGGFMIPHDEKRFRYGDDAWFGSEPLMCLGVCDGVGEMSDTQWRVAGFDCRGFGEDILREAKSRVQTIRSAGRPVPCSRPRMVLPTHARRSDKTWIRAPFSVDSTTSPPSLLALEAMVSGFYNKTTTWGAATCLFGCLNDSGTKIGFANIGDSRALILRRGQFSTGPLTIIGHTEPEQHGWNLPVQLARLPDRSRVRSMREDARLKELVNTLDACRATGQDINDPAESAILYDFNIQEGDLILLASDGLWDNIFDDEVAALCGVSLSPYESEVITGTPFMSTAPRDIAKGLCLAAYWRTLQHHIETPFAQSVREAGGMGFDLGGKPDDITAVVAWVVPEKYENNQELLVRSQREWHAMHDSK